MDSNFSNTAMSLLLTQLQFHSERFDHELNQEDDLEAAKLIFLEIRTLKERISELNFQLKSGS